MRGERWNWKIKKKPKSTLLASNTQGLRTTKQTKPRTVASVSLQRTNGIKTKQKQELLLAFVNTRRFEKEKKKQENSRKMESPPPLIFTSFDRDKKTVWNHSKGNFPSPPRVYLRNAHRESCALGLAPACSKTSVTAVWPSWQEWWRALWPLVSTDSVGAPLMVMKACGKKFSSLS